VLHDRLVELESPVSVSLGCLLMSLHAGGVEEGHAELDAALLHEVEQELPDAQASPADEGLSSPPPGPQFNAQRPPWRYSGAARE
jgi:hypothetical protein